MTCPRCGALVPSLADLADQALTLSATAARVVDGWRQMRLAVPQALAQGMRDLEAVAPRLAAGLACLAGRCAGGPGPGPRATAEDGLPGGGAAR